jgi:enoyl-CoA hydratase/carnithine racemase
MLISLIHDIEVPTIGVIPGPGSHTELALMCDLTLCSDNAIVLDPHFDLGLVPGNGSYGLVNEVVPRDKLMDRAWEIARRLASKKRTTRRMSVQVMRRPWKKRIVDDLDGGFAMEMHAYLCDMPQHRDRIGKESVEASPEFAFTEADRKKGIRTTRG